MKKIALIAVFVLFCVQLNAQKKSYTGYINSYWKQYVDTHEVVKGHDRAYFRFFKPNTQYRVTARFSKITDTIGFIMKTSGKRTPRYFRYGTLHFKIHDTALQLTVYRSQDLQNNPQYKDYLFVPYTDLTSGEESYGGGKYLEFYVKDIKNNSLLLDFNKAYNPYCAYASGYNCPVPPRENDLPVAIRAGEMNFAKGH
ncbi:MAG: DUF1684 domain-containing protein [Ferruginibacter sp.]